LAGIIGQPLCQSRCHDVNPPLTEVRRGRVFNDGEEPVKRDACSLDHNRPALNDSAIVRLQKQPIFRWKAYAMVRLNPRNGFV